VLTASKVFVEFAPQSRIEGDIQQMPSDFEVTELWEVLAGRKSGRDSAQQITVFDSVGFALEDFSALRFMHQVALEQGMGERLALIPQLSDPKICLVCYCRTHLPLSMKLSQKWKWRHKHAG